MILNELIKSLPTYERNSLIINEIFKSVSKYLEESEDKILLNMNELFIDTAVKALDIHARDLGVSIDSNLSLEQKRELITAYYRATFEQTNEETIKNVAASFSGGLVEINPTETDGIFEIKFVDTWGVPNNIEGLRSALDVIIPAHLEFIFAYSYVLIREISSTTLSDLEKIQLNKFAGGEQDGN